MQVINRRYLFYRTARRAHGAVSIAAAMRYQSTQYAARQCRLSIYPARHLFYRGNDGGGNVVIYRRAAMQVINRRHLFYRTARRAHGAVNYRGNDGGAAAYWRRRQCRLSIYPARHLFYRGNDGNTGYQLPRGNALLIYRGNDGGNSAMV